MRVYVCINQKVSNATHRLAIRLSRLNLVALRNMIKMHFFYKLVIDLFEASSASQVKDNVS